MHGRRSKAATSTVGFAFDFDRYAVISISDAEDPAPVSIVDDPSSSCLDARDIAVEHLTAIRAQLRELKALEQSLIAFVKSCDTSCAGGPGPECVILDDLAKPSAPERHHVRRVSSPS